MSILTPHNPQQATPRHGARRWLTCVMLLFALLILATPLQVMAEQAAPGEYEVKAALIYTVTKFIDWPDPDGRSTSPLCIAVIGRDPFGNALDRIRGKLTKGRNITIKRIKQAHEATGCDILFVSASEKANLPRILQQLKHHPVLTISDQPGFCQSGGIINLVTVRNKVNFEINVAAAHQKGIRISSRLLRLAVRIFD